MNTYVLTRHSTGYGELTSVVVKAATEDAARLAVIREYRSLDRVAEFADPELSAAVLVSDDAVGIISTTFSAS